MADKVTIVAYWETGQMSPLKEWNMWRQLKGAYHIDRFVFVPTKDYMANISVIDQYDTMEEALASLPEETNRVFLEPSGYNGMYDLPHGDIALILGNTSRDNMAHAQVNETYAIKTEGGVAHNHLYGINAAAIALAFEYGQ